MFKVYKTQCNQCLLSKNAIVSPERRDDIIKTCISKQTFFICHKSPSMETGKKKDEVCCKGWYKAFGQYSQMIRISERLNVVEEVEHD